MFGVQVYGIVKDQVITVQAPKLPPRDALVAVSFNRQRFVVGKVPLLVYSPPVLQGAYPKYCALGERGVVVRLFFTPIPRHARYGHRTAPDTLTFVHPHTAIDAARACSHDLVVRLVPMDGTALCQQVVIPAKLSDAQHDTIVCLLPVASAANFRLLAALSVGAATNNIGVQVNGFAYKLTRDALRLS